MNVSDTVEDNQVKITLPLPNRKLSPNAIPHHMELYRLKKAAKNAGHMAALLAVQEQEMDESQFPWEKATTQATFYFLVNRRRDGDNHNAMLKAYLDGVADAGIVNDDEDFIPLPPIFEVVDSDARVEIEILPYASSL